MADKQTILFSTHVGNMGGSEATMLLLAEEYKENCEVCTFEDGDLQASLTKQTIKNFTVKMPKSIIDFKRDQSILTTIKLIPEFLEFLFRLSKVNKKYDVIVCMSQKSFVLSAFAKIFNRKPIIWFMNDILDTKSFSAPLIKFITLLSKLTANHVILNSQASKDAWLNVGGQKENISIIHSGIDTALFQTQISDEQKIQTLKKDLVKDNKFLIGTFGRLCSWKGQDVFIKAMAKIENAQGIIVGGAQFGEDDYKEHVEQLVKDLGLENRITFIPHTDKVAELMAACDLTVHCSTSPEPFGRVIIESMLAKTPIVASKAGGPEEIITQGENGYLSPMGDHDALSSAIQHYLDTPTEKQEAVRQSAYAHATKHYSSDAMNILFDKILKDLN